MEKKQSPLAIQVGSQQLANLAEHQSRQRSTYSEAWILGFVREPQKAAPKGHGQFTLQFDCWGPQMGSWTLKTQTEKWVVATQIYGVLSLNG